MHHDNDKSNHVIFVLKDIGYFLSHRQDLANFIISKGVRVSLVTDLSDNGHASDLQKYSSVLHFPFSSISNKPWKVFFPTIQLIRLLRANRLATVFSVTIPAVLVSGLICRFFRIRQIILFAGLGNVFFGSPNILRRFIRCILKAVTRKPKTKIIAQNKSIQNYLLTQNFATEVELISGSGIDENAYKPPNRLNQNKPLRFLFLSRMLREKGAIEFIDAAKSVITTGAHAEFILAGRTDPINPTSLTETEINKAIENHPNLSWIGHVENVQQFLASVDVVCLPSYHEGLPRVLLEGALMGCCLIASDITGCNDVVFNRKTGILVKPKSSQSLEEAFLSLINGPEQIPYLALNARDHVLRNFTNAVILPKYWDIIQQLVTTM